MKNYLFLTFAVWSLCFISCKKEDSPTSTSSATGTGPTISWDSTIGLPGQNVKALLVARNGNLYAGTAYTGTGIYLSTNGGNSWIQINSGLTNTDVRELAEDENGRLFAGTAEGLFRSTDQGMSWTTSLKGWFVSGIATQKNNVVYVSLFSFGGHSPERGYLLRSHSSGIEWEDTLYNDDAVVNYVAVNNRGYIFSAVTLSNTLIRSTDNGRTFSYLSQTFGGTMYTSMIFLAETTIFATRYGTGVVYSTDDGDNWLQRNNDLLDLSINTIVRNQEQKMFIGSQTSGCYSSSDNGIHWIEENTGLKNHDILSLAVDSTGVLFVGTFGDGVFRGSISSTAFHVPDIPRSTSPHANKNYSSVGVFDSVSTLLQH